MIIQSKQNAKYKAWVKLKQVKGRKATGFFIVEGEHLVEEAIRTRWATVILNKEGFTYPSALEHYSLSADLFDGLCTTVSKDTVLAICKMQVVETSGEHILICDDIQDPGNLGTMLRTAYSFGFNHVYCSKNCVDVFNDKVVRASQGALFYLEIKQDFDVLDIQNLKDKGHTVYATGFENSTLMSELDKKQKLAIIMGNEGQGVRKEWLNLSDAILRIETTAFNSLNVGVATGILLHHFR